MDKDFETDLKNALELLKTTVIDIEDYFVYDTSIIRVTLDGDKYYVCADNNEEALDKVIGDHVDSEFKTFGG